METRKILIVTKTYPEVSTKYNEVVCTAGILLDDHDQPLQWIRIYPIRYRDLNFEQKYPRWGIISAQIERNFKDSRRESYRIDDTSIKVLEKIGTAQAWKQRKAFFEPLIVSSIDDIKAQQLSLGVIKPQDVKYSCSATDREWPDSKQVVLSQGDLMRSQSYFSDLEKIPYKFFYKFRDSSGKNHKCSIIDWEISQLYRKMRDNSTKGTIEECEREALEKVRVKLEDDFLIKRDLYFLMGNLKRYPNSFVIIGLIYPPFVKHEQLNLLDL